MKNKRRKKMWLISADPTEIENKGSKKLMHTSEVAIVIIELK